MALINPHIAKRERLKLRLSLDELGRRAGVNKATLHRIEGGRMTRNAEHVVDRLAKVFKLEPDQLTAHDAHAAEDTEESVFSYRSQFNLRLSHESRNALALVAKRYGVRPLEIVEFAPLLFHLVAAETLAERSARLCRLREAREHVERLGDEFAHLSERMVNDWNGEEIELREERSIAARDIRGDLIDEGDDIVDARPLDYDPAADNPFVSMLRNRLATVQGRKDGADVLEYWSSGSGPRYEICRDEALKFVGGDEEAGDALLKGRVGVHEIPKDLRTEGAEAGRASWVRERSAELAKRNTEWLETLGLADIDL